MTLLQLLFSFLQIGLLSIGGGYAALPIIQDQVVAMHGWLSMREFADILTISQMTPGPIAINAASFVGTKIAGLPGALVASLGVVLPSFIIVLTLSFLYYNTGAGCDSGSAERASSGGGCFDCICGGVSGNRVPSWEET